MIYLHSTLNIISIIFIFVGTFISTINQNCPKIKILSMMNNEAAPSYFNGGSYEQFIDYRY